MDNFCSFGDIFRFNENDYVYFFGTAEVTFAAKILDDKLTAYLSSQEEWAAKCGKAENNITYCFVILSTEGFKNKAAHFGKPEMNNPSTPESIGQLNKKDTDAIKKEIIESRGVPIALKEFVKGI